MQLLICPFIRSFSHSIAQYFSHRAVALLCMWKGQYLFKRQLFSPLVLNYSVCGLCLLFKLVSAGRSCSFLWSFSVLFKTMVLRCFRNLVLFLRLSKKGGDGDSALFVLQMRSGEKEEWQVGFFQVTSLKCVGPGLYCPQTFGFLFKHVSIKHSCSWHIFSCESLFMTLIFSDLPSYCFSSFSYFVTHSQIFL